MGRLLSKEEFMESMIATKEAEYITVDGGGAHA